VRKTTKAPLFKPAWAPKVTGLAAFKEDFERFQGKRPSARRRGYDADWQQLRRAILEAEPSCRECRRQGRATIATTVDHIETIRDAPERRLDPSNCQPMCRPCHQTKTIRHDGGLGKPRRPVRVTPQVV
jgi:5-methylcytosine-specific restriction enzyme A